MNLITLTTNKGGSGKTTIATNLAIALALKNKKTILVDLDGLCSVNFEFGQSYQDTEGFTIFDVLNESKKLEDCLVHLNKNLDILLADPNLRHWDELIKEDVRLEAKLKQLLNKLKQNYDYAIIDTPPQMSHINYLAIEVSNLLVIPFELEQINAYSVFATLAEINSLSVGADTTKLLVANKVRLDWDTKELKLNKAQKQLYDNLMHSIEKSDPKALISSAKVINSSQFNQCLIKYNLPLMAIKSNSKVYAKAKQCLDDLANVIINL